MFDRQVTAECHSREVCKMMCGSTDVNLEQIRAGMAWWYREYAKEQPPQEREQYAREEEGAEAVRVGLWKDPKAVPPWEWRKLAKN